MWTSTTRNPAEAARRAASANSSTTRAMSSRDISRGAGSPSRKGTAPGAIGVHPPALSSTTRPPRHGTSVEALRPACASCMPATAPCASTNPAIRAKASRCASDQIPVSCGEIRPSGETAVASTITSPAPPTARLPRWTKCQSVGRPSSAEYWHIGETKTRLRNSTPPSFKGEKSVLMGQMLHDTSRVIHSRPEPTTTCE